METKMIGNKIATARKKINMSQAQLSQLLFISPQAVGKWERGESMPDILTLSRLAEILAVDLNYFSENFQSDDNQMASKISAEDIEEIELYVDVRILPQKTPLSKSKPLCERHVHVEILRSEKSVRPVPRAPRRTRGSAAAS